MAQDTEAKKGLARRAIEAAIRRGLARVYRTIRVEPDDFLVELRTEHGLPVSSYAGMSTVPVEQLDRVADDVVRSALKMSTVQGAGFGLGGLLTALPDVGALSALTMRTIQKLSLVYGFPYNSEEEEAELWTAAATAAGVDIGKDLVEKTIVKKFVQRVIRRIASRLSAEFAEKLVARAIPVVSSVLGAGLNYWFVRSWSRRAIIHFRERHLRERERRLRGEAFIGSSTA